MADVGAVWPVQGGQLGGAPGEGAGPRRLESGVVIARCATSLNDGHRVELLHNNDMGTMGTMTNCYLVRLVDPWSCAGYVRCGTIISLVGESAKIWVKVNI